MSSGVNDSNFRTRSHDSTEREAMNNVEGGRNSVSEICVRGGTTSSGTLKLSEDPASKEDQTKRRDTVHQDVLEGGHSTGQEKEVYGVKILKRNETKEDRANLNDTSTSSNKDGPSKSEVFQSVDEYAAADTTSPLIAALPPSTSDVHMMKDVKRIEKTAAKEPKSASNVLFELSGDSRTEDFADHPDGGQVDSSENEDFSQEKVKASSGEAVHGLLQHQRDSSETDHTGDGPSKSEALQSLDEYAVADTTSPLIAALPPSSSDVMKDVKRIEKTAATEPTPALNVLFKLSGDSRTVSRIGPEFRDWDLDIQRSPIRPTLIKFHKYIM